MKLKNQIVIVSGLACALFLLITSFPAIRNSLPGYVILTLCFSAGMYWLLKASVIRRIENLNQQVKMIDVSKNDNKRVAIEGQDEIAFIGININAMLDGISSTNHNFERRVEERTSALENLNQKLKQSIAESTIAFTKAPENKEYLANIARYDSQTSLPNRVFFNEILNKAMSHAKRHNKLLAIMLIDMDSFAKINATIGENRSDFIIKEITRRFTNVLRHEDILAKLDGDEFIVLLNDINKAKFASAVASKILQVCSHPMKIDEHEFSTTASIGICVYPNDGSSLEDLLRNADNALYKAKANGGNNFQYYTHQMDAEAREYIQLESALRKALHNNELALYYQPKFSLRKGNIVGVEALMRWEHPVLGLISPAKFIPLAEDAGLIMQIGEWALREACRTTKFWQDEGYEHINVSLNLSARQFHHPEISKVISNALKITGLNPKYLGLEISETTVMNNVELAAAILDSIKMTGVQISLDHFGTGYTSISALKLFPINTLKIDQSFIRGVANLPNDMAIATAIIALAHNLGLEVVAQGVETAEQVQFLSGQNCDMVQGYFLSHPQSAQKIVQQLKKISEEAII